MEKISSTVLSESMTQCIGKHEALGWQGREGGKERERRRKDGREVEREWEVVHSLVGQDSCFEVESFSST